MAASGVDSNAGVTGVQHDADAAARQLAAVEQLLAQQEAENKRLATQATTTQHRALAAPPLARPPRPTSPGTIAALEASVSALESQLVAVARANAAEAMDLEMQLFEAKLDGGGASERASLAGGPPLPVSTPLARARAPAPRTRAPPSPIHARTGSPRRPGSGVTLAPLGGETGTTGSRA